MSILSEIQWKCEADLDQRVKFGRMTVSCEGYNGVDDEWVVDGSCSLQYELERTYSDEWEYSEENSKYIRLNNITNKYSYNNTILIQCCSSKWLEVWTFLRMGFFGWCCLGHLALFDFSLPWCVVPLLRY